MNLRAIFPKYRIMFDASTYKPYYIQRRFSFGLKWYFHAGYFDTQKEAREFLTNHPVEKKDMVIEYV